jgi:hypothetical protein
MERWMDWQPGADDGTGPDPDPSVPGRAGSPGRTPWAWHDPRLAEFARDDSRDAPRPSGRLALLADALSGPERRCPGATDDELIGLLQAWAGIESWAAAAKLGVIREMMRRDRLPSPGSDHGDLPETWSPSLRYELAAALACSTQSADSTASLAWELRARLPGIGARLEDGTLTQAKAKAVTETLGQLMDADAANAEAMITGQLAGKTYTQVLRLAEQAALTVDPALAERRREHAQKKNARVSFFREQAGTAALSGRDLPPDEALAAMATVNARAEEYKESDAFGDTPMDVLRATAYLDLINGRSACQRIAIAEQQNSPFGSSVPDPAETGGTARSSDECPCAECDGSCHSYDDGHEPGGSGHDEDDDDSDDYPDNGSHPEDGHDDSGPGGPGPGGPGPRPGAPPTGRTRPRRPADLIVPLATLLGLGERPGEIHGFGLLDPGLARQLAAAAAASPCTEICVTVTSPEGYAIGHGCAKAPRTRRRNGLGGLGGPATTPTGSPVSLPIRLNVTVPATLLRRAGPENQTGPTSHAGPANGDNVPGSRAGSWSFVSRGSPATSDGFGTWTIMLPDGGELTVRLDPVPTFSCDHRYDAHGYQPTDRLRHLVQVRDGTCTFPCCNRHARESDFEHALPYTQGGRTCACNAGARSRACHRIKQSPGWNVTQPGPGWHQWETPSGRIYTQEPKRYPS